MTEQEQIDHERLVAQILKIRSAGSDKTSTLGMLLNSTVLTAVIGVVGTGVLGAYVSGRIQDRSRNNEIQRQAEQVRLESQNTTVNAILKRVGEFLSATDDLLFSVNHAFAEKGRPSDEVATLQKWKTQIRDRRDAAELEWRREKRSLGFMLQYVFEGRAAITDAWGDVLRAVDDFEICTRGWYTQNGANGTELTADKICSDERVAFERAIETITREVAAARRSLSTSS